MASPRARRNPSEDDPGDVVERERSGPLELERHLKADGRALILYTRPADTDPAASSAGGERAIEDPHA